MLTFPIPAWTIPFHALVPLTTYLIATRRDEDRKEPTQKVVMNLILAMGLGTLLSCIVAAASPVFHRTFSTVLPSFARETVLALCYLGTSTLGLFIYHRLNALLEE
jgi:hypothetical protein